MQKNSFLKRGLSLLLVAVMMLGMLPNAPVWGDASGGSSGTTKPLEPGDFTYSISYSRGSFTRFTIVEIAASDDSTTTQGTHTPDSSLNPHTTRKTFCTEILRCL